MVASSQPTRRDACAVFDTQAFLDASSSTQTTRAYHRGETIFTQGDAGRDVLYIQSGGVTLSVVSASGRAAVVATLGPGEFFGEACLAGQPIRTSVATALTPSVIRFIASGRMMRLLGSQPGLSERFIAHLLSRSIRDEETLVSHLFDSGEKQLACALLRLAHYGTHKRPARVLRSCSPETLAATLSVRPATVRSLLARFKALGFIDYDGRSPLTINRSLLKVVLND
jgi:CRP/FNR family transcriptional regulator, cyclic AMP receptor protein